MLMMGLFKNLLLQDLIIIMRLNMGYAKNQAAGDVMQPPIIVGFNRRIIFLFGLPRICPVAHGSLCPMHSIGLIVPKESCFVLMSSSIPTQRNMFLWFNVVSGSYVYVAATSDNPEGPFVVQNKQVNVSRGQQGGDFDLFVDADGTGYVVYSQNYVISVEQLTPDFLYSTGKSSLVFTEFFVEAPTFFVRNGSYYILFGWCCCFCQQGSGILVHTATAPLGYYNPQPGDLACVKFFRFSHTVSRLSIS